jgi:hypothetical protein
VAETTVKRADDPAKLTPEVRYALLALVVGGIAAAPCELEAAILDAEILEARHQVGLMGVHRNLNESQRHAANPKPRWRSGHEPARRPSSFPFAITSPRGDGGRESTARSLGPDRFALDFSESYRPNRK